MVRHRTGRGLMLLCGALGCGGGLALAVVAVWQANHGPMGHAAHLQSFVLACYAISAGGAILGIGGGMLAGSGPGRRVILFSCGMLLGTGLLGLSTLTQGRVSGVLDFVAGASFILTAATSFAGYRSQP